MKLKRRSLVLNLLFAKIEANPQLSSTSVAIMRKASESGEYLVTVLSACCCLTLSSYYRIRDLEDTLLAYHNETELTKKLGWFHNIILGTFHSAAFTGDHVLLRRHLKLLPLRGVSIDTLDKTGMSPLHWATLKGYEVCVRLLLDRGADVDILQKGHNTPLLLAAAAGHDTICRLLIDRGAAVRARNHRDHDAVFMAVVYGHSSKGLPWTLQLLHAKGLDLNQSDNVGATPLHYCAQRNLARPVRMLVDSGANVNAIHGTTQLTPLQMACSNAHPDVETIRSFLDKGAYPNWKDIQGRTAFDFAMRSNQPIMKAMPGSRMSTNISEGESKIDVSSLLLATENEDDIEEAQARGQTTKSGRWRPMEGTIQQVGDWAVKALPALLELSKKGAKFQKNDLDLLRPSFRAAVLEAHKVWKDKESPPNFLEFVLVREQSGEDLILNKGDWIKDKSSTNCQLCSDAFGITNRRHHCRACGVLVCDDCSSKKLQLKAYISNDYNYSSVTNSAEKKPKDFDSLERVCDGCFNRLCHEAIQPSPDHFRVKALKQCAYDLIFGIQDLVDSLEDPDGDPNNFGSSVRETMSLTKELDNLFPRSTNGNGPNSNPTSPLTRGSLAAIKSSSASFSMNTPLLSAVMPRKTQSMMSLKEGATNVAVSVSEDGMSDPLKLREEKLHRTEELIAKFTEVRK